MNWGRCRCSCLWPTSFLSVDASRDLFDAAAKMLGHRRGGLAYASISRLWRVRRDQWIRALRSTAIGGPRSLARKSRKCASAAMTTGLSTRHYRCRWNTEFSGQMIPPSGALIVFGIIAETSIGQLFTAAIIPGITQALFYALVIFFLVRWKPELGPAGERASWPRAVEGAWANLGSRACLCSW